jgi:hypothetical protein
MLNATTLLEIGGGIMTTSACLMRSNDLADFLNQRDSEYCIGMVRFGYLDQFT